MANLTVSSDEARAIVYGDTYDWEQVEVSFTGKSRWSVEKEGVFKHIPTGKFYRLSWDVGATEMQKQRPFEYEKDVVLLEVAQVEKLVKVWEVV